MSDPSNSSTPETTSQEEPRDIDRVVAAWTENYPDIMFRIQAVIALEVLAEIAVDVLVEGDDEPTIPGTILKNGTVWKWRDGEYVDTGREPSPTEAFRFAMDRVDTPFMTAIKARQP